MDKCSLKNKNYFLCDDTFKISVQIKNKLALRNSPNIIQIMEFTFKVNYEF